MTCAHAFQTEVEIVVAETFAGQNGFFELPDDKCLVIEYISGEAYMPEGQKALFGIITTAGGTGFVTTSAATRSPRSAPTTTTGLAALLASTQARAPW